MKLIIEEIIVCLLFVAVLFVLFHSYKAIYPPEYFECLELAEKRDATSFSYNVFSGCTINE